MTELFFREIRFFYQKITRGFSGKDLWDLRTGIAEFILPRLIEFRDITASHPPTISMHEWGIILSEMVIAFELIKKHNGDNSVVIPDNDYRKIERGLRLFSEYYLDLWI